MTVNLPAILGASTALAGFTGGTGGQTVTTNILNWSYTATGPILRTNWGGSRMALRRVVFQQSLPKNGDSHKRPSTANPGPP
jgi:hypothetical protein